MTLYFLLTAVAAFLAGAALGLVLRRSRARRDLLALRSLQARFDSLFAAGNAAMALCDENHRITSANPRLVEITGRLPDELAGAPLADLLAPEDRLATANMLSEISAGRRDAVLASTRLETADRGGVPVSLWAARNQDQGLVGVFVENGLSAQTEQRLRESRDLLTSLLEAIPIPIFLVDDSGDFLWANHAFSEFLGCGGCGPEEAEHDDCRRQAHTIFSPDDPFLAAAPGADTGTESREIRLTDSQGRTREMDLSLAWVDQGGGSRAVAGALLDLSEPRAASRRLEEALAELQAILDNSLMGVALIRDGQVVKTNRRGARMFGYDPDEIQGAHASVFLFSKDQYRRFSDAAEDAIRATGRYEGEQLMRRKDGTAIWCRLHARSMREDDPGHGVLWTVDDFTERKLMEEELVAAKEIAEAASHAKTQFLANMSHEIRTPLNAVTGLTDILLSADLGAEHRELVATIQDATKQLLAVLSDILDYARL
ncbi:MAG: PAS domain S-box protein, partial [Desulfovibrionaceae bacterium]